MLQIFPREDGDETYCVRNNSNNSFCFTLFLSALPRKRYDDWRDDRGGRFDRRNNRDAELDHRRRGRSASPPADREPAASEEPPVKKKKEELDPILTRTGGAYIPPAKLRMMQQQITDKSRYECCFYFAGQS